MRKAVLTMAIVAACPIGVSLAASAQSKSPHWLEPMREVHRRFTGAAGTLALFGDSITVSLAFWAPLAGEPKGQPRDMVAALERVKAYQRPECWREWRGPEFGNSGGMTVRWARKNVSAWLKKLNPEVAVVLFGTNDLTQLGREEYERTTREVVRRCLDNGTVVLLTTIPPRAGLADRASEYAESVRKVAIDLKVPLIDYHTEILRRRPDDWNGALPRFKEATRQGESEYDVGTLIARDGVHPSNPKDYQDYSAESLSTNGYSLRNYLTLLRYAQVIESVLAPSATGAGPGESRRDRAEKQSRIKTDPARLARIRSRSMPEITQPVLFHTAEADTILSALEVFPPDNPFNQVIEDWPLHPNSRDIVASIGLDRPFRYNTDMGFVLVPPDQKRVDVRIVEYPGESDAGPYPVPDNVPIEGWPAWHQRGNAKPPTLTEVQRRPERYGGDRHAIIVDPVNRMLYEFFTFGKTGDGWAAGQASIFDLKTNRLRPDGWTSADAAGLPIFPAVVRYDELQRGIVEHAMRVTVRRTRRAYVHPATHYASRLDDTNLPRMGERLRLRADFDISTFSPPTQAILKGLKKYGAFVADNGIDWAISVTPDPRIPVLHEELRRIKGRDFQVVVAPE